MIFKANKSKALWLFLLVPLTSLCSIAMPLALREFTSYLVPSVFYDCD